jgi:hypothetical protein
MACGNQRPSGRLCFSTMSLAPGAARSSSPSLRGPPMPRAKKPSGGATRFPPLPFRRRAILRRCKPEDGPPGPGVEHGRAGTFEGRQRLEEAVHFRRWESTVSWRADDHEVNPSHVNRSDLTDLAWRTADGFADRSRDLVDVSMGRVIDNRSAYSDASNSACSSSEATDVHPTRPRSAPAPSLSPLRVPGASPASGTRISVEWFQATTVRPAVQPPPAYRHARNPRRRRRAAHAAPAGAARRRHASQGRSHDRSSHRCPARLRSSQYPACRARSPARPSSRRH